MNKVSINTLKALRKVYAKIYKVQPMPKPACEQNPDVVSQIIYNKLIDDKPCMIARFGANELSILTNYQGIKNDEKNVFDYIKGRSLAWWWNDNLLKNMLTNAGFFPPTHDKIEQFCKLMHKEMKNVDVLGSWLHDEANFVNELNKAIKVRLMYLDPFWTITPWTKALEGKKVLIIHPFADTIKKQYAKRELLFDNKDILPRFSTLEIIKAVQSIGKGDDRFNDWFEALEYMKTEIDKVDFDIALIGCGAYGFPLAAHVKRNGKKAVHIGGSLQLLFGIKGKRWENDKPHTVPPYNTFVYYHGLMNEHWVRPNSNEKPSSHKNVEGSCYW